MRCPKCGFITFDLIDTCRKCHKPIKTSEFQGTTYPGASPNFLVVPEKASSGDGETEVMVDLLDPDLDLLAESDDDMVVFDEADASSGDSSANDGEITLGDDFEASFNVTKEPQVSLDEDDLMIDTSRFENVPTGFVTEQTSPLRMQLPDELADISDLSRPAAESASSAPAAPAAVAAQSGKDDDLDFGDLNLDDLGLTEKAPVFAASGDKGRDLGLDDLSLDDIDLSGELMSPAPAKTPRSVVTDVDLNFDLDLDLGEIKQGGTTRKPPMKDDLPDFHLSLD